MADNEVTITEGQARVLRSNLRKAWVSDNCTAELDAAVRALDEQIESLDRRPRPAERSMTRADLEAAAAKKYPWDGSDPVAVVSHRAAYIQGRLDQAAADAALVERLVFDREEITPGDAWERDMTVWNAAIETIAAAIREGVK